MEFLNATVDQITNIFVQASGSTSWLVLIVVFLAVFVLVMAVAMLLAGRSPVERRLAGESVQGLIGETAGVESLRQQARETPWKKIVEGLESYVTPDDNKALSTMRRRMIHAGFYGPNAVRTYFALRILSAIAFPVAYVIWLSLVATDIPLYLSLYFLVILAFVGYILPRAVLDRKIQLRQLAVQEGFPDSLDMMVVCVEAGLGLDAAFNRVGTHMASAYPVLSQHFAMVALELRAGKSREEALRGFADRIGLPEISSFVTLMIQSDQLGTSIAQTLRVHSDEMRTKRMLRAEEKAMRLPVLLAIPLVVGILPSMMTVALLPSIIRVVRVLVPALSGDLGQ